MVLNIPVNDNKKLKKLLKIVNSDVEIQTLWYGSNIVAIDREHMSDHGHTHVAIVTNAALLLLRNLVKGGVKPSIVKDHKLKVDDSEVVVFLACCLHDIGHVVHRKDHAQFSVPLAVPILKRILSNVYKQREATIILGEILHAIRCHDTDFLPFTIEAGIVRISDALDMAEGRSRIPFSIGEKNIHSVSAMSIDNVEIKYTKAKPIFLHVEMTNSAGIYQLDELLKKKIKGSGLEKYVKVSAKIRGESEVKIINDYEIEL